MKFSDKKLFFIKKIKIEIEQKKSKIYAHLYLKYQKYGL